MSALASKSFSRLWRGRSRSETRSQSADFAGDAAPPFAELASGLESAPTPEELERIQYYHSRMTVRDMDFVDMDLTNQRRRLICAGRLFRTDSTFERKGMYELFVLLFDNYLVTTQIAGTGSDITFQVYKRPIPLDLLRVEAYADPSNRRGSVGARDGPATFPPETWGIAPTPGDPRAMLPLIIHHDGRSGSTIRLYAESENVQLTWKTKLEEAILLRQKSSQVFEMSIVVREESLTIGASSNAYPPENRPTTRTITCAAPFVTRDGRTLLAIGCMEGLWIGSGKDLQSFRWALRLPVQQCVVAGDFGLIIVLSNGELHVFDLEACVPKSTGRATTFRPKILETKGKPYFFRVGKLGGGMYVVAAEKKHLDTIFYVWETVMSTGPDGPSSDPQEFVLVHNFFLPVQCNEVVFLRKSLCIMHHSGFNLVKFKSPELSFVDVPQAGDQNVSECKKAIKRCSSGQPLWMTRVETEVFILCYDKFGMYVDRHGVPLVDREIVEWEGQAERASFRFPYVLLFCSTFVEVRNLITGHLTQVIRTGATGNGGGGGTIRCLWDGRGGPRNFDLDLDFGGGGDGGSDLPTVLGVAELPTTSEWGAQSSSVMRQQCVFTLFSPVPPPYSLVGEPVTPYDADSLI